MFWLTCSLIALHMGLAAFNTWPSLARPLHVSDWSIFNASYFTTQMKNTTQHVTCEYIGSYFSFSRIRLGQEYYKNVAVEISKAYQIIFLHTKCESVTEVILRILHFCDLFSIFGYFINDFLPAHLYFEYHPQVFVLLVLGLFPFARLLFCARSLLRSFIFAVPRFYAPL